MKAARIRSITLPRHIWRRLEAAHIRDVTLRGMPREGEGSAATGHLAMNEGSAHWECYFAENHRGWVRAARIGSITLPREGCRVPRAARIRSVTRRRNTKEKFGAARIRVVISWRDARGNEGSAHSGSCFFTGYLAIGENSAHSRCCRSTCHRGTGEGSAFSRRCGYTDDEGSAHSGGTSCVGRQGWVRAARMQSVPSSVCGTMRDIKRRRDHAVKIMRL